MEFGKTHYEQNSTAVLTPNEMCNMTFGSATDEYRVMSNISDEKTNEKINDFCTKGCLVDGIQWGNQSSDWKNSTWVSSNASLKYQGWKFDPTPDMLAQDNGLFAVLLHSGQKWQFLYVNVVFLLHYILQTYFYMHLYHVICVCACCI